MDGNGLILSMNPAHDGALAVVKNRTLLLSSEAERDSQPRHMPVTPQFLLETMFGLEEIPAIVATSGWSQGISSQAPEPPYHGVSEDLTRLQSLTMFGRKTWFFESTHERSHIFCSYGLSPFRQGEPCYALIWEGSIGSFYEIDSKLGIQELGPVLSHPGYKYAFLFDLADPTSRMGRWRLDTAGKLMALKSFGRTTDHTSEALKTVSRILREVRPPRTSKEEFKDTSYFNCGVTDPKFCELVSIMSDAIFDAFHSYARQNLRKGYPLIIGGGCGLNCEWNSKWRDSGLFRDVFVPPVANDSGCAIGTAIEAQYLTSGCAKISWDVYRGIDFVCDTKSDSTEHALDYDFLAEMLAQEKIVAFAQGRSEIGPRALGNRSLLAAPFKPATRERLNAIKQREWYRPIAPVCLEEDASRLFGLDRSSPFMLYFQSVRAPELEAVTHVDGSARVQTVNQDQNPTLFELLKAFKRRTGFGVLCNTSLNLKGRGFINRSSDLFAFAKEQKIDLVVVNSRCYLTTNIDADMSALANVERRPDLPAGVVPHNDPYFAK
jgi:predicted NodU family carbamoyl transferase